MMSETLYVIWSFEHRAWWGVNHCGYVENFADAGRYSAIEAGAIVTNSVMGEEVALCVGIVERNGAPTVKSLWEV